MNKCRIFKDELLIADNICFADTYFKRLKGLLKHKDLESGEGILIIPCKQVHTFGMKFSIDVIFLSKDKEIIYIENSMQPGKISKYIRNAAEVLEIKAGTAKEKDLKEFDHLSVEII